MDEQIRIILIIIVSVSIFGLLVFVFVKNYIRNKINHLADEEDDKKSGEEYAVEDLYSCPEQLPFVKDCPNIKDKYKIGKYIGKGAYSIVKVA